MTLVAGLSGCSLPWLDSDHGHPHDYEAEMGLRMPLIAEKSREIEWCRERLTQIESGSTAAKENPDTATQSRNAYWYRQRIKQLEFEIEAIRAKPMPSAQPALRYAPESNPKPHSDS